MSQAEEIDTAKRLLIGGVLGTALIGTAAQAMPEPDPMFEKISAWRQVLDDVERIDLRIGELEQAIDQHFAPRLNKAMTIRGKMCRDWPGHRMIGDDAGFRYIQMRHYRTECRHEVAEQANEIDRLQTEAAQRQMRSLREVAEHVPQSALGMIAKLDFFIDEFPDWLMVTDVPEAVLRSCRDFARDLRGA